MRTTIHHSETPPQHLRATCFQQQNNLLPSSNQYQTSPNIETLRGITEFVAEADVLPSYIDASHTRSTQ